MVSAEQAGEFSENIIQSWCHHSEKLHCSKSFLWFKCSYSLAAVAELGFRDVELPPNQLLFRTITCMLNSWNPKQPFFFHIPKFFKSSDSWDPGKTHIKAKSLFPSARGARSPAPLGVPSAAAVREPSGDQLSGCSPGWWQGQTLCWQSSEVERVEGSLCWSAREVDRVRTVGNGRLSW